MRTVENSCGLSWTAASSSEVMIPRPSGAVRMQIADLQLRLAEELRPASVLELDERAQQDADRLVRDTADAGQILLAGVRGQVREERAQVGEVDQAEAALVGEAEEQGERLLLRLVRAEHLAEQLRAEVGHGRAHGHAVADAAEREELDRIGGRLVGQSEVGHALRRRAVGCARVGQTGEVALVVGREDRDAGVGELLGDQLQRSGLPGAGGAGDQAVPVHRRHRQAHERRGHDGAVVDTEAEIDRVSLDGVRS